MRKITEETMVRQAGEIQKFWSAQRQSAVPRHVMELLWSEIISEAIAFIGEGRDYSRNDLALPVGSDGLSKLRRFGWELETELRNATRLPVYEAQMLKKERSKLQRLIAKLKRKNAPVKRKPRVK